MFKKRVGIWLIIGLIMIYFQIILGGITRLTGSGLSITKWEIVTGTLPPLNESAWEDAFNLYKQTPQFEKINSDMTLAGFKSIYFWEYVHRVWARSMGFVFLIPLIFFLPSGMISRPLMRKLILVVVLAAVVASFGWIMVASGLINRPWVNAYKLSIHLCLAVLLYAYLLWTTLWYYHPIDNGRRSALLGWFVVLMGLQIFLGGLMSGMKAALFYPTFPDYRGYFFPQVLYHSDSWNVSDLYDYDRSALLPALVQVGHRTVGYVLAVLGGIGFVRLRKECEDDYFRKGLWVFLVLLVTQILLGISVLVNSVAVIPITLGVLHQGVAILLLSAVLWLWYFSIGRSPCRS